MRRVDELEVGDRVRSLRGNILTVTRIQAIGNGTRYFWTESVDGHEEMIHAYSDDATLDVVTE